MPFRQAGYRNGNGASNWIVIAAVGGVILSLANGFWSVANPRNDLTEIKHDIERIRKDIPEHYLTLREHKIYVDGIELRLNRIEKDAVLLPLYQEANKARESQIARVAERLGIVESTTVPKDTLTAMQGRMDRQDMRLERMETWLRETTTRPLRPTDAGLAPR